MSGFSGIFIFDNKQTPKLDSFVFPSIVKNYFQRWNQITTPDYAIHCYNNRKFLNESYIIRQNGIVHGIEGILLNKKSGENPINSSKDFVNLVNSTKGTFSGIYIDEHTKEIRLFADHTASHQLFYYWDPSFVAFSSSIFLLTDILRHFDVEPSLSENAAYMMLSLGYMLEDFTLISEIKKIKAGQYASITASGIILKEYHNYYRKIEHTIITKELLHELDDKFKSSIEFEFQKDTEYGYNHLATLSGGLDSRLNVMLGYKNNFKNITCLTFSEGFMSDETTSRKITSDLSLKHIVLLLNNGFQLFDIETPLILNNCAVVYYGASQTLAAVKSINFLEYGLLHNGGFAESSKGGYLSGKEHSEPRLAKMYSVSDKLFNRIEPDLLSKVLKKYPNEEMFVTYNRGFNAVHNGTWMSQLYTEFVYCYMDTDFADLAYSVDPKLRYNGYLTVEWINRLHPDISKYPWQRGFNPTNNELLKIYAKVFYRSQLILGKKQDNPVPIEKWYQNNPTLKSFIFKQYEESLAWDELSQDLKKDVSSLFNQGNVREKLLCISFLKSIELLFKRPC